MNFFEQQLSGLLNDAQLGIWLVVALVAAGIFFAGLSILSILFRRFDPMKKRLNSIMVQESVSTSVAERFTEKLDRIAGFFVSRNHDLRKSTIDRLNFAGFRSPNRLAIYSFIRMSLIVSLPLATVVICFLVPEMSVQKVFMYVLCAAMIGMIAPSYYLDRKIESHQRILKNALPDAIDLLVVCTEAGLGLNAALLRVARELVEIHPALAEELLLVTAEMRAGVERNQAMINLATRTGLADIKSLVAVLAQSMRFGTSVAQTLRIYSEEFRSKRMQRADEEAAKLTTKMLFPLVCCFLPAFFIVAVGPAVIHVMSVLPTLGR